MHIALEQLDDLFKDVTEKDGEDKVRVVVTGICDLREDTDLAKRMGLLTSPTLASPTPA